jgi:hypothetical protein
MSKAHTLFGWRERERLRRYLIAWDNKLALDTKQIAAIRARLETASVVSTDELPADEEVEKTARSPLAWSGATLLGRRQGDEFEWRSRGGSRRVRIEAVMPQSKAMDNARSQARVRGRKPRQHPVRRNGRERRELRSL